MNRFIFALVTLLALVAATQADAAIFGSRSVSRSRQVVRQPVHQQVVKQQVVVQKQVVQQVVAPVYAAPVVAVPAVVAPVYAAPVVQQVQGCSTLFVK